MKKTFIISFEGGEAVGKSTQVKMFTQYLADKKINFLQLREPGGTKLGEKLRALYIDKSFDIDPSTEVLLMNAMRSKLCHEVLKPIIDKNEDIVIVLDRFYHSSFAYQHYGTGASLKMVKNCVNYATEGIKPDLTIFLSQDPEISYARKVEEGKQDRFEIKGLDYYKKIEYGYRKLAKKDKIIKTIQANQPIDKVHADIVQAFEQKYNKR